MQLFRSFSLNQVIIYLFFNLSQSREVKIVTTMIGAESDKMTASYNLPPFFSFTDNIFNKAVRHILNNDYMKTIILLFVSLCMTIMLHAQVSKTADVTPGNLKTVLTTVEQNTVTNLTLTGTMDARDFKTLRDDMPSLTAIDLSVVRIVFYAGADGSGGQYYNNYAAYTIPYLAFYGCNVLTSVAIPASVTDIGLNAFMEEFYNYSGGYARVYSRFISSEAFC